MFVWSRGFDRVMFKLVVSYLFAVALSLTAHAQEAASFGSANTVSTATPIARTGNLPAGRTVRDGSGRIIENLGTNQNGSVQFTYTGRLTVDGAGNITCSGDITTVTNPASQGSNGQIVIHTNGLATTVNLDRNGAQNAALSVRVLGGNATINVGGDWVELAVGGTGNQVHLNGRYGFGEGTDNTSEGNVRMRSNVGNGWRSNGGNWTVRS